MALPAARSAAVLRGAGKVGGVSGHLTLLAWGSGPDPMDPVPVSSPVVPL
jgi:hypothetical protein